MKKNNKTKKWATLDHSFHFGSPNYELSIKLFFLLFGPIGFPFKMMPCKLNHNLICLNPGPSSKGLGKNLKFLIDKNS